MKKKQRTNLKNNVIPMVNAVYKTEPERKVVSETFKRLLLKGSDKEIYSFMQDLTRAFVLINMQEDKDKEKTKA